MGHLDHLDRHYQGNWDHGVDEDQIGEEDKDTIHWGGVGWPVNVEESSLIGVSEGAIQNCDNEG